MINRVILKYSYTITFVQKQKKKFIFYDIKNTAYN